MIKIEYAQSDFRALIEDGYLFAEDIREQTKNKIPTILKELNTNNRR
jgi:hypothetical protein